MCVMLWERRYHPCPPRPLDAKVMAISWTEFLPVPICAASPPDYSCEGGAGAEGEAHHALQAGEG